MTLAEELTGAIKRELDRKPRVSKPRVANLSRAFADALKWYQHHPVQFVTDMIGAEPDEWQADALRALADHDKVAVFGCTGSGKDALAAWVTLWFVACFPYTKGLATAPNSTLLDDVLWAEIHKWLRHSPSLQSVLEWTATEIRAKADPAEWFLAARVASLRHSPDGNIQVEGLAGRHADNMLLIIDEASGVAVPFFETLEGTMTGRNNKLLVLGNPLRVDGRFFEIFNKPKIAKNWRKFYVAALGGEHEEHVRLSDNGKRYTSSHADVAKAKEHIETYGVDAPFVQARVFGNFPITGAIDTAFTYAEVTAAMQREVTPADDDEIQIGVDCARFGDDETIFIIRKGWKIVRMEIMAKSSATQIAGRIAELCAEFPDATRPKWNNRPAVVIDEAGAGGGGAVCDFLWAQGYANVMGVGFGNSADDEDKFYNLAAEMWLSTLVKAMPHLQLPDDEVLLHQLVTRKYEYTGKGQQRRVESKDSMKRRGLTSPDRADALCLALYSPAMPGIY